MPSRDGMLDVLFERRSVIRPNGDVDELLALRLHNVTTDAYEFVRRDEWVTFRITDSPGHCVSAHDPLESSSWEYGTQNGEFVLAARPTIGIQPGHTRAFGAHIFRTKRAWVSSKEIQFDDPVPLGAIDPAIIRNSAARAIVILPERADGWAISSPELGATITTRFAVFDFAYSSPDQWQPIRVTARAPSEELLVLAYDDIMADLNILLGQDICGQAPDVSDVLGKIGRLRHPSVRDSTASLRRGIERDRDARTDQLRRSIDAMQRARFVFFREATIGSQARGAGRDEHSRSLSLSAKGPSRTLADATTNDRSASATIDVFFSYSHKDELLRDELATHLAQLTRANVIRGWHDRKIEAGEDWRAAIHAHLEKAQIVLLLVSADFLASEYCYDEEMTRALARHDAGEAVVVPVILRDCRWNRTPLARLQALPKDAKPITSWTNRDEAWTNVAIGIEAAIARLTNP